MVPPLNAANNNGPVPKPQIRHCTRPTADDVTNKNVLLNVDVVVSYRMLCCMFINKIAPKTFCARVH